MNGDSDGRLWIPPDARAYVDGLLARLQALLARDLAGVYLSGSVALGDYVPGRSDVDALVVIQGILAPPVRTELVTALRHEALPCPARGLELVVYRMEAVRSGARDAPFELNLNTGLGMAFRATSDLDDEPAHWFTLDRAIAREHGIPLAGPPAAELLAPIPREAVLEALAASIRWHLHDPDASADDAVLNACRAARFAEEGAWSSKAGAAVWAARSPDAEVAGHALAARTSGGEQPDPGAVRVFLEQALGRVTARRR